MDFGTASGRALQKGRSISETLIDLGSRFRFVVNEVEVVAHPELPKLPVARAVWECQPDCKTACAAWIYAGRAHHTGYSYAVMTEIIKDFAAIAGVELAVIDVETWLQELRLNDLYHVLAQGLRA